MLLEIRDLHARVEDQPILKGVNLTLRAGEIHAVMGRNGSGKSTLSKVLAGHPAYTVTAGSVTYRGADLLELDPEQRARIGLFLGFQYPVEIPGVSNLEFLRVATNARRAERGEDELDTFAFEDLVRLLRWREEAQRDSADGPARAPGGHPRRDRFRPRHRCAADCGRRGQPVGGSRQRHPVDHPLPAPAGSDHPRLRARDGRGPDPAHRRQGAGPGAGAHRLRLGGSGVGQPRGHR
ncbi:MAG: ATP-binding cassette domain-containing protein [Cyanobium sp. LacPavin_0818_WC50_MAG_67_9]|nr:ATP-binding cassette domain-containing protein [Cyanobium sp. LacPavin_0818_WC50_MAG_67_9]